MFMESYTPSAYWEQHLRQRQGLLGTGHRRFSLEYNIKMYAAAAANLQAALSRSETPVVGADVLDVGSGFGYYVDKYLSWEARSVTGVDLTQVAVEKLRATFEGQIFHQADISEPGWHVGTFGLVSAISMIFHIVDGQRFKNALTNLCRQVSTGGSLLIVDAFRPQWWPTASHARLRDLTAYTPTLESEGFTVLGLYPLHRWMGRAWVPVLGPALLNRQPLLDLFAGWEGQLGRAEPPRPGWLNILIARRTRRA